MGCLVPCVGCILNSLLFPDNVFIWLFALLFPWLYVVNLKTIWDNYKVAQTLPSSSWVNGSINYTFSSFLDRRAACHYHSWLCPYTKAFPESDVLQGLQSHSWWLRLFLVGTRLMKSYQSVFLCTDSPEVRCVSQQKPRVLCRCMAWPRPSEVWCPFLAWHGAPFKSMGHLKS